MTIATFGMALVFHSLIDGMAIGVFNQLGEMTVLAISVIIHKIPVACTLGTTFLSNNQKLDSWLTRSIFVLFVLASPLGMLLGILLDESASEIHLVIIQSFSGGTFIYLAACDLIIHQFHDESG